MNHLNSSPSHLTKLPARNVKVSVNDQSSSWKQLSNIIFTDFFFTFPSKEEGINIVPEFIEESPEQVALMSIGSDPYKRPSLSIYVYDFFENESNNNVFNWISQREMIASNYLVIGLEKDKLFSKTNQNLNFGFDSKHFLLIQFKTTKKLSEKIIQTVRKIIQEHIINDFEQCKTEIENKIRTSENAKFLDRLKVWKNLFLFSFGFIDKSLKGYKEMYNYLIQKDNIPLNLLLKYELSYEQITSYPYTLSVEPVEVLLFSFHGLMSVYYQKGEWNKIVSLFLSYFGFLRNKSQNNEDFENISKWSIKAIKLICSILINSNEEEFTISLYILLFEIEYQINYNLDEIYQLLNHFKLPEHILSSINGTYLIWEKFNNKKLIDQVPLNMINWKLGSKSIYIHFKNSIKEKDKYKSINFGINLLHDNSSLPSNKKLKVFNQLSKFILNEEQNKNKISNLFQIKFQFQNEEFKQEFITRKPGILSIIPLGATWLTINLEEVKIIFLNEELKTTYISKCYNIKLNEIIYFKCSFPLSGTWKIHKFLIQHKQLILTWLINTNYNIYVNPIKNIEIKVNIPKIILQNKIIPISIEFNFLNILAKSMHHIIKFNKNNIKILKQIQQAKSNTGENLTLEINENGQINYKDKIPFLTIIKFFIEIEIENLNFIESELTIDTFIDNQQEFTNKIQEKFIFPIIYNILFTTNEIMHIQIQNIDNEILKIENNILELTELHFNESCYLIYPKNEKFLNLTIYDIFGNKIFHQFNIQEKRKLSIIIHHPNKSYYNGEFISVETKLPNCNYEFILNNECIITGIIKKNNFKEGILNFYIIPVKVGIIEIPNIQINNVEYMFEPHYLNINSNNTLSYGPLF